MELINRGSVQIRLSAMVNGEQTTLSIQPHGRVPVDDNVILDPNQSSNPFLIIQRTQPEAAPVAIISPVAPAAPEVAQVASTGNSVSQQSPVSKKQKSSQHTSSKGAV